VLIVEIYFYSDEFIFNPRINVCIFDELITFRYFSRKDTLNSLSLIVEDLTGLGLVIIPLTLEGFSWCTSCLWGV